MYPGQQNNQQPSSSTNTDESRVWANKAAEWAKHRQQIEQQEQLMQFQQYQHSQQYLYGYHPNSSFPVPQQYGVAAQPSALFQSPRPQVPNMPLQYAPRYAYPTLHSAPTSMQSNQPVALLSTSSVRLSSNVLPVRPTDQTLSKNSAHATPVKPTSSQPRSSSYTATATPVKPTSSQPRSSSYTATEGILGGPYPFSTTHDHSYLNTPYPSTGNTFLNPGEPLPGVPVSYPIAVAYPTTGTPSPIATGSHSIASGPPNISSFHSSPIHPRHLPPRAAVRNSHFMGPQTPHYPNQSRPLLPNSNTPCRFPSNHTHSFPTVPDHHTHFHQDKHHDISNESNAKTSQALLIQSTAASQNLLTSTSNKEKQTEVSTQNRSEDRMNTHVENSEGSMKEYKKATSKSKENMEDSDEVASKNVGVTSFSSQSTTDATTTTKVDTGNKPCIPGLDLVEKSVPAAPVLSSTEMIHSLGKIVSQLHALKSLKSSVDVQSSYDEDYSEARKKVAALIEDESDSDDDKQDNKLSSSRQSFDARDFDGFSHSHKKSRDNSYQQDTQPILRRMLQYLNQEEYHSSQQKNYPQGVDQQKMKHYFADIHRVPAQQKDCHIPDSQPYQSEQYSGTHSPPQRLLYHQKPYHKDFPRKVSNQDDRYHRPDSPKSRPFKKEEFYYPQESPFRQDYYQKIDARSQHQSQQEHHYHNSDSQLHDVSCKNDSYNESRRLSYQDTDYDMSDSSRPLYLPQHYNICDSRDPSTSQRDMNTKQNETHQEMFNDSHYAIPQGYSILENMQSVDYGHGKAAISTDLSEVDSDIVDHQQQFLLSSSISYALNELQQKSLPKWLKSELEKMDNKKSSTEMDVTTQPRNKSTWKDELSGVDDTTARETKHHSKKKRRSPSNNNNFNERSTKYLRIEDSNNEDEEYIKVMRVRQVMTEVLLAVTTSEMYSLATEIIDSCLNRFPASSSHTKNVSSSSRLDNYGSDSDSDHDISEKTLHKKTFKNKRSRRDKSLSRLEIDMTSPKQLQDSTVYKSNAKRKKDKKKHFSDSREKKSLSDSSSQTISRSRSPSEKIDMHHNSSKSSHRSSTKINLSDQKKPACEVSKKVSKSEKSSHERNISPSHSFLKNHSPSHDFSTVSHVSSNPSLDFSNSSYRSVFDESHSPSRMSRIVLSHDVPSRIIFTEDRSPLNFSATSNDSFKGLSPSQDLSKGVSPSHNASKRDSCSGDASKKVSPSRDSFKRASSSPDGSKRIFSSRDSSPRVNPSRDFFKGLNQSRSTSKRVSPSRSTSKRVSPFHSSSKRVSPSRSTSIRVSPSRDSSKRVSPFDAPSKKFSSLRDSSKRVSPSRDSSKKVSPSRHTSKRVSPSRRTSKRVSPSRYTSKRVSPSRNTSKRVSPFHDTFKRVNPSNNTSKRLSPSRHTSKMVSPSHNASKRVSSSHEKGIPSSSKRVSPSWGSYKRDNPSHDSSKRTNPSHDSSTRVSSHERRVSGSFRRGSDSSRRPSSS